MDYLIAYKDIWYILRKCATVTHARDQKYPVTSPLLYALAKTLLTVVSEWPKVFFVPYTLKCVGSNWVFSLIFNCSLCCTHVWSNKAIT